MRLNHPGHSETILDLDREEHIGAVREALLFCCLDRRPVEKRVGDAIDALLTCAKWFPTEEADVGRDWKEGGN